MKGNYFWYPDIHLKFSKDFVPHSAGLEPFRANALSLLTV